MTAIGSEQVALVGIIDPDVTAASTVTTGWVAAKDFFRFMAIVAFGTAGSSATLNAKIQQATDGSGTAAKDLTGSAITQMLVSDKQTKINFAASDLDVDGGFTHVRLSATIAVATSDLTGILLGIDPRHAPASDNDAASVVEIVTV